MEYGYSPGSQPEYGPGCLGGLLIVTFLIGMLLFVPTVLAMEPIDSIVVEPPVVEPPVVVVPTATPTPETVVIPETGAQPPAPVIPQTGPRVYVVVAGDTLSEIALRHGVSLAALLAANPQITNPDLIFPGQQINIPEAAVIPDTGAQPVIPGTGAGVYVVQPGDTLSGIAQRYGIGLAGLIAANPQIANPNLIFPGQQVNIPSGGGVIPDTGGIPNTGGQIYVVRRGDSMSGIAAQFGLPLNNLLAANPQVTNPRLIFPGQQIVIPGR